MISFKEASFQVGYDNQVHCPIIQQYAWYAYKNGEVRQFFDGNEAANFSPFIEKFCSNQQAIDEWIQEQTKKHQEAVVVWREALKLDYVNETFSAEMFDICYNEAINKMPNTNFDNLAEEINRLALFAIRIKQSS